MAAHGEPRGDDVKRWRMLWEDELAGAALYRALADASKPPRREIFLKLAEAEERHAAHWADKLTAAGAGPLTPPRPPMRTRILSWAARRFGVAAVLPTVLRLEATDADKYDNLHDAGDIMAAQERGHGKVVAALSGEPVGGQITRSEGRHRIGAGGALRAAVFGVNDGLVSNLSLVMGIAGGTGDSQIVLLAGVAGLLAGAFSMAAGEWVSVQSQRELFQREIDIERAELEEHPEEEREELVLIFQAKGVDKDAAEALADRIMSRADVALDTLAREELGLDPNDLSSPWVAAWSSFGAFSIGAFVPVLPYLLAQGSAALWWAATMSGAALFGVGAFISAFTGRRPLFAGVRMMGIGSAAAAVTYFVGAGLGVAVS